MDPNENAIKFEGKFMHLSTFMKIWEVINIGYMD